MNAPTTTEQDTSTVPDSTDSDGCPMCGSTTSVQPITGTSPRVQAWSCTACSLNWAISVINPHLRPLIDLAAAAAEIGRLRWTLAQVIAVADDAPGLTDVELRTRLLELCAV